MCDLSGNIMDYHNVSQGKTTIPNVDDGEECTLTDVRRKNYFNWQTIFKLLFHKKVNPNDFVASKFGFRKSEMN